MSTSTPLCPSCGQPYPDGAWPICDDGTGRHGHTRPHGGTLLSSIHPSERTVVYQNPKTGEIKYPPRNDQPMPKMYERAGYVRQELTTMADVKAFERSTGKIHERSHYDPGSATAEREIEQTTPEAKHAEYRKAAKKKLLQELKF